MGKLLSMPTRYWSLGPDLAQPLLDGGQRIAAKAQAASLTALDIQARRLNATVTLITALGGMW